MDQYMHKSFHSGEPRDLHHGGHGFDPYGKHDWTWFMVDVLAHLAISRGGIVRRVSCDMYLTTILRYYLHAFPPLDIVQ